MPEQTIDSIEIIGGVDEVGRGPLAGPVVACTAVFGGKVKIEGLRDSKKLSAKQRQKLRVEILREAMDISVSFVSEDEIDKLNIYQASLRAMGDSFHALRVKPSRLLVDAVTIPRVPVPQEAIVRGDSIEPCIMAASIMAKEARDEYMQKLGEQNPGYGLEKHKGYGTRQHLEALRDLGVLSCHRRSFRPVMEAILQSAERVKQELNQLNSSGIVHFVQRARSMGLENKLHSHHQILNEALSIHR